MTAESDEGVTRFFRNLFIVVVIVFNIAVMATALGIMFVVFEGNWRIAGPLFAIGGLAWAVGFTGYAIGRQHLLDRSSAN